MRTIIRVTTGFIIGSILGMALTVLLFVGLSGAGGDVGFAAINYGVVALVGVIFGVTAGAIAGAEPESTARHADNALRMRTARMRGGVVD